MKTIKALGLSCIFFAILTGFGLANDFSKEKRFSENIFYKPTSFTLEWDANGCHYKMTIVLHSGGTGSFDLWRTCGRTTRHGHFSFGWHDDPPGSSSKVITAGSIVKDNDNSDADFNLSSTEEADIISHFNSYCTDGNCPTE